MTPNRKECFHDNDNDNDEEKVRRDGCKTNSTMKLNGRIVLKLKEEMKRLVKMKLKIKEAFVTYEQCLKKLDESNQYYSYKLVM